MQNRLRTVFLGFVVALCVDSFATAQGLQSSPYAAPTLLRRDNLSFAPSNTYDRSNTNGGFLKEHQSDLMGASWLKDIPNLQTGYVYYSAEKWRAGYLTLDYILPIRVGANSVVFGEAHSEFQVPSMRSTRRADDQVYLSMGGGYRTILRKTTLMGINGFYDGARFARQWVSSGGAGLEWAALLPGYDALDMNFNWYGDLFNVGGAVVYQKRNGPSNFEFQAGYSHQLFEGGPDLRLYGTAYKFDDKSGVWGWQAGFELKTPNGVMSAKGETAYDHVNNSYQTVSAFVNIGFQLENLLSGRNPFAMPERIFNSPRNFNRLTDKAKRNWQQTVHGVSVVAAQNNLQTVTLGVGQNNAQTITVVNNRSTTVRLYMGMTGGWGRYSAADFPGFSDGRLINCNLAGNVVYRDLQPGE